MYFEHLPRLPCPACGWREGHRGLVLSRSVRHDACRPPCQFETAEVEARCGMCDHVWRLRRAYSEPDTAARVAFEWKCLESGRGFREWYEDEPDEMTIEDDIYETWPPSG